jgi:hypothetical protein
MLRIADERDLEAQRSLVSHAWNMLRIPGAFTAEGLARVLGGGEASELPHLSLLRQDAGLVPSIRRTAPDKIVLASSSELTAW